MQNINTSNLKEDQSFTGDLYIDNTLLILPHSVNVSKELLTALKDWEFTECYCEGNVSENKSEEVIEEDFEDAKNPESKGEELGGNVKKAFEDYKNNGIIASDNSRLEAVKKIYLEYANYIESLYTHYSTHKEINQEELAETVKELCIFVKENKRYILRIIPTTYLNDKNFLIAHSLKTTVISIAIGLQLHMTLSKMIELGTACILHEIGMLRLPPQVYMATKQLTNGERAQITKHTVLGYSILKEMEFPLVVQIATLEHHEKENGTGYPRKLTGDKISPLAKIISVACSYEAITSARNYKAERSTFDAMVEMLMNKNHTYDDSIIKALLYTVSLYPIGTYVYLKNRKVAVVTDTNPTEPKCPVVQLLTEKEKDGSPIIIQTNTSETGILRVLTKQEQEDVIKITNEKYKLIEEAQKLADTKPIESKPKPAPKPAEATSTASGSSNILDGTEEVDISFFN